MLAQLWKVAADDNLSCRPRLQEDLVEVMRYAVIATSHIDHLNLRCQSSKCRRWTPSTSPASVSADQKLASSWSLNLPIQLRSASNNSSASAMVQQTLHLAAYEWPNLLDTLPDRYVHDLSARKTSVYHKNIGTSRILRLRFSITL